MSSERKEREGTGRGEAGKRKGHKNRVSEEEIYGGRVGEGVRFQEEDGSSRRERVQRCFGVGCSEDGVDQHEEL